MAKTAVLRGIVAAAIAVAVAVAVAVATNDKTINSRRNVGPEQYRRGRPSLLEMRKS